GVAQLRVAPPGLLRTPPDASVRDEFGGMGEVLADLHQRGVDIPPIVSGAAQRPGGALELVDDVRAGARNVRAVWQLTPHRDRSFHGLAPGPQHRATVPLGG